MILIIIESGDCAECRRLYHDGVRYGVEYTLMRQKRQFDFPIGAAFRQLRQRLRRLPWAPSAGFITRQRYYWKDDDAPMRSRHGSLMLSSFGQGHDINAAWSAYSRYFRSASLKLNAPICASPACCCFYAEKYAYHAQTGHQKCTRSMSLSLPISGISEISLI